MIDEGFFIVLDRVRETLDNRKPDWAAKEKKFLGTSGRGRIKMALKELMISRITIAYDVAAAFMYLHENQHVLVQLPYPFWIALMTLYNSCARKLLYRDIKPDNIGFDVRGYVKTLYFDLCKSLAPELKALDGCYGYKLMDRAGSLPSMALEVARMESYDSKCDVCSLLFYDGKY
jgi:serine/threonine protein kinase